MNKQWLEFLDFPQALTFEDSKVGLLVLSTDIGIVLKIYKNAAHFRWMNKSIQMLDDFAQPSLLNIPILKIVYQQSRFFLLLFSQDF